MKSGIIINGTHAEMLAWINSKPRGAKACVVATWTMPVMLEKSRITKVPTSEIYPAGVAHYSVRSGMLGAIYENAVNNQRTREESEAAGEFTAQGGWMDKSGVAHMVYHSPVTVQHDVTGNICFKWLAQKIDTYTGTGSYAFNWVDRYFNLNNKAEIVGEELAALKAGWFKAQSKSKVQDVEHDVQWRTLGLNNTVEIRHGEIFRVHSHLGDVGVPVEMFIR